MYVLKTKKLYSVDLIAKWECLVDGQHGHKAPIHLSMPRTGSCSPHNPGLHPSPCLVQHAEQSEHMISIDVTWSEKIDCLPDDEDWMTWRHLFPPVFMETKKRRGDMQQCWKIVIIIRVSRLVHSLSWLKAKHREANTQEWTPLHVPVDMYQCWIQRHIRIHDACVYADGYYFYIIILSL